MEAFEKLHEDSLGGFALVDKSLCADLQATNLWRMDPVVFEQIGDH